MLNTLEHIALDTIHFLVLPDFMDSLMLLLLFVFKEDNKGKQNA